MRELAAEDSRIAAVTAAMKEGTGLGRFASKFPDRFYDVGIAEPHAVTFAAGMAASGARPVVAIYSTFLQRSYDEIIHDVCLQSLPVVFAIDRAGLVGEDGPTHHGVFDLSYLRHIPGLVVMAPKDSTELRHMLGAQPAGMPRPVAIRYPRGKAMELGQAVDFRIGEAEVIGDGTDLAIIAIGSTVGPALSAMRSLDADGIRATVVNLRTLKPLDATVLRGIAARYERIITVEENSRSAAWAARWPSFITLKALRAE